MAKRTPKPTPTVRAAYQALSAGTLVDIEALLILLATKARALSTADPTNRYCDLLELRSSLLDLAARDYYAVTDTEEEAKVLALQVAKGNL